MKYAITSTEKNIIPSLFHSKSQEDFWFFIAGTIRQRYFVCVDHIASDHQIHLRIRVRVVPLS